MRITLSEKESNDLILVLWGKVVESCSLTASEKEIILSLYNKITDEKFKDISPKKIASAKKATQSRVKKSKEKITNAVNILRLKNREVTTYTVSLESGCSFNTCKKYTEYWS